MAKIARDTYDRCKRQSKIIFQETKPLLNYELNLAQDILNEKSIDTSKYGLGNNYVGDSFSVYPSTMNNEIFIKKGIFYHNGYPIELTEDVRINALSTPSSDRIDSIYAEWYISEINGTDDPSIVDSTLGFETTVQERIILEIKIRENAEDTNTTDPYISTDINPDPISETITYNDANKTISLDILSGNEFPNWLLSNSPTGVTFTTSDPQNPGPFTINLNSSLLNKKTLVVNESLNDTPPHNSIKKLSFYDSNSNKSWIAHRRNFFKIANLNRNIGNAAITNAMIEDVRDKTVFNHVVNGCAIELVTSQSVKVNSGRLLVGDTEQFIEDGTQHLDFNIHPPVVGTPPIIGQLQDNTLNFVFINKVGNLECSQMEPLDFSVFLADVYTYNGSINSIIDKRIFVPFAWKNKYGSGCTGETGFPTISHPYKAAEDLDSYTAVAVVEGTIKEIVKATALDLLSSTTNPNKLPTIGITGQFISLGQIDNVVTFGEIQNLSWNFTKVGKGVFLDVASGLITQTPPTAALTFTQRIGVAISSNILFVNPEITYIKNNPAVPFDTNFLVKRSNGLIEESTTSDKFSPNKLSFLASMAQDSIDKTFNIYPGKYFINDTEHSEFSGETINLGSGTYQTSPLTANYFNKAFFTLDDGGTVHMYESLEQSASSLTIDDPAIPDNELPLSMITFQDDGSAGAGTIKFISQNHIEDKRNWLNLGNLDNTSFKPIYRNANTFLVQKGESWFNNVYIESGSNILVSANTASLGSTYYIYMDLQDATGSVSSSSFTTMLSTPSQINRRRYIPLGEYVINGFSEIIRTSFKAYKSKFWQYRDTPYTNEETINFSTSNANVTLNNYTFLNTDYLDIKINGRQIYEFDDYVKVTPNIVNFNYLIKKGAKAKIRKV